MFKIQNQMFQKTFQVSKKMPNKKPKSQILKKKLKEERKQKQMVKLSQDKLLMYMKEVNLTILENLQEKSI